jgi:hypothetical protein
MAPEEKGHVLTGLVRLRDHCTFAWEQRDGDSQRTAIVRETHCEPCVTAAREMGYLLRSDDGAPL